MYSQKRRFSDLDEYTEFNRCPEQYANKKSTHAIAWDAELKRKKLLKAAWNFKKPRMCANSFSEFQQKELERLYVEKFEIRKKGRYATIAHYLNLDEYDVSVWFRNRAVKTRRIKKNGLEPQEEIMPAELNKSYTPYYTSSPELYDRSSESSPNYLYNNVDFFQYPQNNVDYSTFHNINHLVYPYDFTRVEAELMQNYEMETLQNEKFDVLGEILHKEFSNVNFEELKHVHRCKLTIYQLGYLKPFNVLHGIDKSEFNKYI